MRSIAPRRVARFGLFEADLHARRLTKSGLRIRLQDQPFQVLSLLLERHGTVVTREEIKDKLWAGDTFVVFDDGLNTAIKKVRVALSDAADNPRFIETVPRVGYCFVAPVSITEEPGQTASSAEMAGTETDSGALRNAAMKADPATLSDSSPLLASPSTQHSRKFLRWGVPVLLVVVAGAIALKMGDRQKSAASSGEEFQSIAVLPLQNMSADPAQEYLADGMTDEIITDLAKLAGPKVISRTSAMQYKRTNKSIPQIARELNVGAVVEGSVESSSGRIRVRVQLIRASTDQHLWAEAYDRELRDVLHLEADLAQDIAQQIQLHLTSQQQQTLASRRATNPEAFQNYLQGREYWTMRTKESLDKAVEYYTRAIHEDPNDARSYAGLAQCYIVLPMLTQAKTEELSGKSREAAQKALALDDSLAEAHLAIAEIEFYQDLDFQGAEKEFRRTLELNPNYATGHQWYGEYLSVLSRNAEAIRELETAIALDPLSAIVHHQAGQTFQQARQYDQAIQEYKKAIQLNPNLYVSYEAMYWAYRRQGKFEQAAQAMQGAIPYWSPDQGMEGPIRRLVPAAQGGKEKFLRQSVEMHKRFRDSKIYLGRDYADLGDGESALHQLQAAMKDQDEIRLWILLDPEFDSIRADSRFQALVASIRSHKAKTVAAAPPPVQ